VHTPCALAGPAFTFRWDVGWKLSAPGAPVPLLTWRKWKKFSWLPSQSASLSIYWCFGCYGIELVRSRKSLSRRLKLAAPSALRRPLHMPNWQGFRRALTADRSGTRGCSCHVGPTPMAAMLHDSCRARYQPRTIALILRSAQCVMPAQPLGEFLRCSVGPLIHLNRSRKLQQLSAKE